MERGFWLLVTGTGRCGTGYVAQVLTSVGVPCSHEGLFHPFHDPLAAVAERQANPWWNWQASSSWLAAPFLGRPELDGVTVVHLVRHPKRVIDSMTYMQLVANPPGAYRAFRLKHLPELRGLPPVEYAAATYVKWNRMIEPHADLRWRIEDSTLALLDWLGIDWHGKDVYGNKHYNTRGHWGEGKGADLDGLPEPLRSELKEIAREYGYEWPA